MVALVGGRGHAARLAAGADPALRPEHAACSRVPQVPLAESFARLQEYPDGTFGELRAAAAGYCGVTAEQVVVGAGRTS